MTEGVEDLSPEPWGYRLLGLISPFLVIAGNLLGGAYTLLGVIFIWVAGPLLDTNMGQSKTAKAPSGLGQAIHRTAVGPWSSPLHHARNLLFLRLRRGLTVWLVAASLSTGLAAAASAIVTAHELGHQRPRSPGWRLARLLLFSINYPHFTTGHNHNHHKNVATDSDPASARVDEGIWSFWLRTIPGQFSSSVKIHNKKGRTGLTNPSYQGLSIQIIIFAGLVLFHLSGYNWAAPFALGWAILSGIAILTLEYVNYIRHWGLRRKTQTKSSNPGTWNTEARWSRMVCWSSLDTATITYMLQFLLKLRPYPDAPTLPSGYYACWWPCLHTPVWRRIMAGRAPGV